MSNITDISIGNGLIINSTGDGAVHLNWNGPAVLKEETDRNHFVEVEFDSDGVATIRAQALPYLEIPPAGATLSVLQSALSELIEHMQDYGYMKLEDE